MSKERVGSWSHAFLITNVITLGKKLLALRPEKGTRRKKMKKTRTATAKFSALNANAINENCTQVYKQIYESFLAFL